MRLIITICLTMMMPLAFADASLTYMNNEGANTMQIKSGVLRSAADDNNYMLYDSKTRAMTIVEHGNKAYTRVDESTMKQMGGAISAAQQQMEEQLKNLPPEQQAQMRQMMKSLMPSGTEKSQPLRSEKTSKTEKAGDWTCKVVNVFKGDEKVSQVCVVGYKSLDVSKEDYMVMKDFMGFISSMSESLPIGDKASFASADLGDGMLPVIVEGSQEESMTLDNVSNDSLDAALFTIPAGYAERNMMEGMPK